MKEELERRSLNKNNYKERISLEIAQIEVEVVVCHSCVRKGVAYDFLSQGDYVYKE